MKKSLSKGSESSNQLDSPVQFHSPMRWDGTGPPVFSEYPSPENSTVKQADHSMAIVTVGKLKQLAPDKRTEHRKPPENPPPPARVFNGTMTEETQHPAAKAAPVSVGGERRSSSSRWTTEETVCKAALGFRLSEMVVCLISFSVMAADKTQGWSGDSFDRYREYRNVVMKIDLWQVLAYLLISASSSAATRVDDWISNWGKDEFTEMATASIGMSFLAFVAFAVSSLISGYTLCNRSSM
ncbi:hypothetical protein ACSQ67_019588 [Phaseolus vulgaris]